MRTSPKHALLTRRGVLRNGAAIATGSVFLPWASGFPQSGGQSWTIGNELVKRVVAFHANAQTPGLSTQKLSDLSLGVDFIFPDKAHGGAMEEFSFVCNGNRCTGSGSSFELLRGAIESNGKELNLRLHHKELALEVVVAYRVYDGHAALRKHLVLRNTGATPLHLSHMNIEALAVVNSSPGASMRSKGIRSVSYMTPMRVDSASSHPAISVRFM